MSNLIQVGVIGGGFVGSATSLLECEGVKVFTYDKDPDKSIPLGLNMKELACCSLIFVCVPTPANEDGSCDTSIVESVVEELKGYLVPLENIIVRSTVPVGTCKRLGVNFMPEFLTEANWREDFVNNKDWILGINKGPFSTAGSLDIFKALMDLAYENNKIKSNIIHVVSTESAEAVKLARNSFLALKVSYFNELNEFCKKKDLNFETIAHCIGLDERIGHDHTEVPGPDGKRGFGGKCFPKDSESLLFQMRDCYMKSYILKACVDRNNQVDRNKYLEEFNIKL